MIQKIFKGIGRVPFVNEVLNGVYDCRDVESWEDRRILSVDGGYSEGYVKIPVESWELIVNAIYAYCPMRPSTAHERIDILLADKYKNHGVTA